MATAFVGRLCQLRLLRRQRLSHRGHLIATTIVLLAGASGLLLLVDKLLSTGSLLEGAIGLLVKELLAMALVLLAGASGLLVDKLLSTALVLLAGASGLLVVELLSTGSLLAGASDGSSLLAGASDSSSLLAGASDSSLLAGASDGSSLLAGASDSSSLLAGASDSSLLAGASGLLVKELSATALVFPQGVDRPPPIQVGAFCAGASPKKDGPPGGGRRQYPSSLFVFAKGSLKPFFVTKGTTSIGRGIEFLVNVEYPVGGAWGRLRPLVLQPRRRIREGGRGQMGRR
jgi:hypothetical protein